MTPTNKALTLQDLRFNPPHFDQERLSAFAGEIFGITGDFSPLKGERDQNQLITTPTGEQFVLKVSGPDEDPSVVDFQVNALAHIAKSAPALAVPRVQKTTDGRFTAAIRDDNGVEHLVRMLSYLPGTTMLGEPPPSLPILHEIGEFQGQLCKALEQFEHPAARHFMPWDISNGLVLNSSLLKSEFGDVERLVAPLLDHFRDTVLPAMAQLRHQVIHNDAHTGNLLKSAPGSDDFIGVIDFGDMIKAPLIQELAISLDSLLPESQDPVLAGSELITGFHKHCPLTRQEVALLYDLCLLRGALTIELYDFQIRNGDRNEAELREEYPDVVEGFEINLSLDGKAVRHAWQQACDDV